MSDCPECHDGIIRTVNADDIPCYVCQEHKRCPYHGRVYFMDRTHCECGMPLETYKAGERWSREGKKK